MRITTTLAAALLLLVSTAALVHAQAAKKVWTDAAEAGKEDPAFNVQGEYAGTVGEGKIGVQVIAQGEDKLQLVLLEGGLPGEGYTREKKATRVDGLLAEGVATFKHADWSATIKEGVVSIADATGKVIGEAKRVSRVSPTMGAKPPEGALVLFDGTSADAWNGKMSADNLLEHGATTKEKFGSFTLHLEFRTPYQPTAKGQGRGNSGVYLQKRYEVQVLDSFGLDGADNECGGIYKNAKPIVNMAFPPLTWQTYDIEFTAATYDDAGSKTANAKVSVKHNGVVIHDNLEIKGTTGGGEKEANTPGPIMLQNHGNPVRFRNIWLVPK